ncbi:MAG TPA: hypothetical protein PKG66_06465 [Methanothrix sp.]|nr:hypothetical protein [Methanothrix sp.]
MPYEVINRRLMMKPHLRRMLKAAIGKNILMMHNGETLVDGQLVAFDNTYAYVMCPNGTGAFMIEAYEAIVVEIEQAVVLDA